MNDTWAYDKINIKKINIYSRFVSDNEHKLNVYIKKARDIQTCYNNRSHTIKYAIINTYLHSVLKCIHLLYAT